MIDVMNSPITCNGVICAPKMSTEPVMSRMSLNTPASVRTSPLPALTRKTAAMFSMNATIAFVIRMSGLHEFPRNVSVRFGDLLHTALVDRRTQHA